MKHAGSKRRGSSGGRKKPVRAAESAAGPEISPMEKLLDAAERLLIKVGHAAVTTRLDRKSVV